ncbi:MAG: hypothetical protein K0R84_247 [Clostridia bacterium]|jgi:hypothetical protein|nr:hypothetical protein [Clostridia bacterium]
MKRNVLFISAVMLLSIPVILLGCSDKNAVPVANQEAPRLTIEEITKKYKDTSIKNIHNIGEDYVLIESQQETFANRFDLYNLNTGDMDIMPTMIDFVTLESIENENYIIFLSSGKNSESPFINPPHLIKCVRIKNEADKEDDFIALYEDKYLPLDYPLQLGCKAETQMLDINISFNGFEAAFGAVKGKEAAFYADNSDIPPTRTIYDKDKKQLIFEMDCEELSGKVEAKKKAATPDNQYISAYEINEKDNKFYLSLELKDTAKQYLLKKDHLPDGTMYFRISFVGES